MIQAVLFVNAKGEVIISRQYRDGFSKAVSATFRAPPPSLSCRITAPRAAGAPRPSAAASDGAATDHPVAAD